MDPVVGSIMASQRYPYPNPLLILLCYMQEGIKVANEIKIANQLTLR